MPIRPRRDKRRANSLTPNQQIELVIGPSPRRGSAFASDDERRAAWLKHRDEIKAHHPTPVWAEKQYETNDAR